MRADGRVPSFHFADVIPRVICIVACFKITIATEYGIPIEIKLWDTGRTPLSRMVDVTNEFGLKVLAEHNFLNDNNIAFSPYGLMGIMVALYEGVNGESSYQVQRAMQLPWNRNVMRIGFRDIHRTLKTYFVPEEGFLAGLALNNENVTFNEQYKKILRFYGFDLENDQLPTLSPETNNTSNATTVGMTTVSPTTLGDTSTATVPMTTETKPAQEGSTIISTKEETTPTMIPTTNSNVETISTIATSGVTSTTAGPSSAPNGEETSISSTVATTQQVTSERITETTTQMPSSLETEPVTTVVSTATTIATTIEASTALPPTTTVAPTTITVASTTTTLVPTTDSATTTPVNITPTEASTQSDVETFSQSSQITSALTGEPTTNNEVVTSTTVMTVQPTQEMSSETVSTTIGSTTVTTTSVSDNTQTESATTSETQPTEQISTISSDTTTASNSVTSVMNESTLETLERRKKSIVDFIFSNPPYIDDYLYYRSFDVGSEAPNPDPDKEFMANGLRSVQVTYMRYDTVLEYAYLPHLEASALRLPLDSDRYYLLVILPTRGGGAELGRLLARMARESDLSDVYSVLRPRRVRGIVPSFIVKGHVTLTTDLQKLGIRDVFEPRQRDFTPMTQQAGVYVRSIEQAVSVAIRKYRPDDHKKNRYVTSREPVVFSATYPFLYFVMDANIHVALMAGKMVDPLNSRIL